jgi:hypothetical protein
MQNQQTDHTEQPIEGPIGPSLVVRGATGPRTELGKRKASRNGMKHAILSEAILIKGESKTAYKKLLSGLREAFQPFGAAEELLVEDLATNRWRRRRLLLAEGAQIQKAREFFRQDRYDGAYESAKELARAERFSQEGLIHEIHNPIVLERCLDLLSQLRTRIEENGFNHETDSDFLDVVYGEHGPNPLRDDVYDVYRIWLLISRFTEEERERKGLGSVEDCRKKVIGQIEWEIRRLKTYKKRRSLLETERTELEIVSRSIPEARELERFVRYEAHLSREFDRTLNQLDRMQRKRMGQPPPPCIDVKLQ